MGKIEADTTFYAWAKGTRTDEDENWNEAKYSFDFVPVSIKYDAKAPEIKGVHVDSKTRTITVTAEDVADETNGASGIVSCEIMFTDLSGYTLDEDPDNPGTFTCVVNVEHLGYEFTLNVIDAAGNESDVGRLYYLPYYYEATATLPITQTTNGDYSVVSFEDLDVSFGDSSELAEGFLCTGTEILECPKGVTVVSSDTIKGNYNTFGSINANSKLGFGLLYYPGADEDDFHSHLGKYDTFEFVVGIKLYNAAAYTIQEDRTIKLALYGIRFDGATGNNMMGIQTGTYRDVLILTITIPGIKSKILSIDVDMGSISLQPGTSAESVSDNFSIKNNNAYPISLTMSDVTAAEDSPKVVTGTPDKTKELKSAGVQVGIRANNRDSYYSGSAISIGNLGYAATQQFNYLMKFSPLYTGAGNESISYNVNFGVSVSAEDVPSSS